MYAHGGAEGETAPVLGPIFTFLNGFGSGYTESRRGAQNGYTRKGKRNEDHYCR